MPYLRLSILLLIVAATSCKKNSDKPNKPHEPSDLRVVGYLYSDNYWYANFITDPEMLTDLNLAFINPDENGAFNIINSQISQLVTTLHQDSVRVYASLAGAQPPEFIDDLLADDDKRATMVSNLAALADDLDLDGIDVDIEGDHITADYADFINELSFQLKSKNKKITAALATWNANLIHDTTLAKFDYINVMSYDATGPWDPSNPGQHSPYEMALADANYFIQNRGIDPKKILIGLPFYGYDFEGINVESIVYRDIVSQYAGAENKDVVDVSGGGKIYYNGIPTIARKVKLAKDLGAAGVMIWEINQDALGSNSLLKAINDNK